MKKLTILAALLIIGGIAMGQDLQKGAVIGAYPLTVTLDPDVTMNQFLDFVQNKTIPAWEEHFEGVKVFMMKGYRGDHKGGYGLIIYCESVEVYDKYWDEKGQLTETGEKIFEKLKPIHDEQSKLGWLNWDFTDWIIL